MKFYYRILLNPFIRKVFPSFLVVKYIDIFKIVAYHTCADKHIRDIVLICSINCQNRRIFRDPGKSGCLKRVAKLTNCRPVLKYSARFPPRVSVWILTPTL